MAATKVMLNPKGVKAAAVKFHEIVGWTTEDPYMYAKDAAKIVQAYLTAIKKKKK